MFNFARAFPSRVHSEIGATLHICSDTGGVRSAGLKAVRSRIFIDINTFAVGDALLTVHPLRRLILDVRTLPVQVCSGKLGSGFRVSLALWLLRDHVVIYGPAAEAPARTSSFSSCFSPRLEPLSCLVSDLHAGIAELDIKRRSSSSSASAPARLARVSV